MCGVSGAIYINQASKHIVERDLRLMLNQINHRGPDSQGIWVHENNKIGLAHSRLSILDLSAAGSQPMHSKSSRYSISYNGEIYNHLELRKELLTLHSSWRGTSDTETLLECLEQWGLHTTLTKLNGMFAFAVWDEKEKKIFLCRDRFGEKPLYYGWISGHKKQFVFSSELQALSSFEGFDHKLNFSGIDRFLKTNNFGGHQTVYDQIYKVLPGTIVTFDLDHFSLTSSRYWSSMAEAQAAKAQQFSGTFGDAVNQLDILLQDVISNQMISDVPIGCFLSGGIDSSLVASIMSAQSTKSINTFSIGQVGEGNEAQRAKLISKALGTNHTELYVDSNDALGLIPNIFNIYGEPFADSSQIPTYLVAKLAKNSVSVALSGDAGDEIFGGYNRYEYAQRFWPKIHSMPKSLRSMISILSPYLLSSLRLGASLAGEGERENIGLKLQKALKTMGCNTLAELYESLIAPSHSLMRQEIFASSLEKNPHKIFTDSNFRDFEQMMIADTDGYLADDILVKVDRAAMRHSLETRVPFLDHRLFSFMWSLPPEFKIAQNQTKLLPRALITKYLDASLLDQPKTGFGIPIGQWLRGPLKNYASNIIFNGQIHNLDILDHKAVELLWKKHLTGKEDHSAQLWSIIALDVWLNHNSYAL